MYMFIDLYAMLAKMSIVSVCLSQDLLVVCYGHHTWTMVSLLGGGLFGNPLAGENSQHLRETDGVLSRGGAMSMPNLGIYFHSLFYARAKVGFSPNNVRT